MAQNNILIIDNNSEALYAAGEILEKFGYPVTLATNGKNGAEFIKKGGFALALIEFALDDIMALSILKTIRSANADTVIVLQSDCAETELRDSMFKLGADDYIFKPYESEELLFRVGKNIENYELKQRTKIQKSILSSCCVCKKIHIDDNGLINDRWMEVEDFLKREMDILLSSTYCPKCAQAAQKGLLACADRLKA